MKLVQRMFKENKTRPSLRRPVTDSLDWLRAGIQNFHDVSLLQGDGIDVICWKVLSRYEYIVHLQRKAGSFKFAPCSNPTLTALVSSFQPRTVLVFGKKSRASFLARQDGRQAELLYKFKLRSSTNDSTQRCV
jgi:hypothetical protein